MELIEDGEMLMIYVCITLSEKKQDTNPYILQKFILISLCTSYEISFRKKFEENNNKMLVGLSLRN